ncbi:hypothetical protein Acid345_0043 [Candidatus Koribacter versatilis Ellin345]|uniref:Uncharacterized protein n=1 Tax=Koribacter versatilis (strain Ellin345) TaxID=204669 RepID=Q1IVQ2_KORVE|nr:hypothetical protein [Candidatus Koribacter versatilis]ABF39048.1 hypothetical protein Acid345_0043 [Candidatus Koribacter versatilis Ellin345]
MSEKITGKCVTASGLPLEIELEWPFRAASFGSDWYVLHGSARLDDASGLHADIAVHLTASIREILTAIDSQEALMASINTVRKAVDDKQLELLKTGKRQPCPLSSRQYSIKNKHWWFLEANDEQLKAFVKRKVYWLGVVNGSGSVEVSDAVDQAYLGAKDKNIAYRLREAAKALAGEGYLALDAAGEHASPTDMLRAEAPKMQAEKDAALDALMAKHAYESAHNRA